MIYVAVYRSSQWKTSLQIITGIHRMGEKINKEFSVCHTGNPKDSFISIRFPFSGVPAETRHTVVIIGGDHARCRRLELFHRIFNRIRLIRDPKQIQIVIMITECHDPVTA